MFFTRHSLGFNVLLAFLISPACAAPTLERREIQFIVQGFDVTGKPLGVPVPPEALKHITTSLKDIDITGQGPPNSHPIEFDPSAVFYYGLHGGHLCDLPRLCYGLVVTDVTHGLIGSLVAGTIDNHDPVEFYQFHHPSLKIARHYYFPFMKEFAPVQKMVPKTMNVLERFPPIYYNTSSENPGKALEGGQDTNPETHPFGTSDRKLYYSFGSTVFNLEGALLELWFHEADEAGNKKPVKADEINVFGPDGQVAPMGDLFKVFGGRDEGEGRYLVKAGHAHDVRIGDVFQVVTCGQMRSRSQVLERLSAISKTQTELRG
ncbi:hypothetical protein BDP27DRAFT_1418215 [Rhodocollybia butyracea]|uniref:Uncharacterized protein n=1 Tax=Rhodocollybia butyracea TaxID=206335 RepID=A0A9P5PZX1_9AGAR|nr:hypothetical protein BDP27DRAFT_1418215 [Rhodocollybia butyracea]